MKRFKDVLSVINSVLGGALFGNAIRQTIIEDYKTATIELFILSGLFIVGYCVERFSN
jgi:hypothetical protein